MEENVLIGMEVENGRGGGGGKCYGSEAVFESDASGLVIGWQHLRDFS